MLGSASLQRELNRLAAAGLVHAERVANLRRFQANPLNPVYDELVNLTRKTLGAEPLLREALQTLAPALEAAWIYGSVAKRTDTAQSDIDLMLVGHNLLLSTIMEILPPPRNPTGAQDQPHLLHTIRVRPAPGRAGLLRQSCPDPGHHPADREQDHGQSRVKRCQRFADSLE